MNPKVLLLIAASLALAGCPDKPAPAPAPAPKVAQAPAATPPPASADAPKAKAARAACQGTCDVDVQVAKNGGACTVTLAAGDEHIAVTAAPQGTNIKWQLQGEASFKFAQPNGIAFDKPSGAPPSSIMQNGAGGGRAVTIHDQHTGTATQGSWNYTIRVTDGTLNCKLDPSVDNN